MLALFNRTDGRVDGCSHLWIRIAEASTQRTERIAGIVVDGFEGAGRPDTDRRQRVIQCRDQVRDRRLTEGLERLGNSRSNAARPGRPRPTAAPTAPPLSVALHDLATQTRSPALALTMRKEFREPTSGPWDCHRASNAKIAGMAGLPMRARARKADSATSSSGSVYRAAIRAITSAVSGPIPPTRRRGGRADIGVAIVQGVQQVRDRRSGLGPEPVQDIHHRDTSVRVAAAVAEHFEQCRHRRRADLHEGSLQGLRKLLTGAASHQPNQLGDRIGSIGANRTDGLNGRLAHSGVGAGQGLHQVRDGGAAHQPRSFPGPPRP